MSKKENDLFIQDFSNGADVLVENN